MQTLADRLYSRGVSRLLDDSPSMQTDLRIVSQAIRVLLNEMDKVAAIAGDVAHQLRPFWRTAGRGSVPLDAQALRSCDCVLLATDHDAVDYALVARHAPLIIDTRNAFARNGLKGDHIVKA